MRNHTLQRSRIFTTPLLGSILAIASQPLVEAAPYASGVSISSTTVSFTLNESADLLTYSLNGGAPVPLDSSRGLKSFSLGSASDTFSITATKTDPLGYTIPTGGTIATSANGFSQPSAESGFRLVSDDSNPLVRFNSPRGVTVAADPNNPQFGTAYISNSAASPGTFARPVGDGLYALKADQSDAFGYGNTAQSTGFEGTSSASSPFRVSVGGDRNIYIADFSDANGGVYRMSGNLTAPTQVLAGVGGPTALPPGQNHGSTTAVYAAGSGSSLTLYTLDEDLTSNQVSPPGSTTDRNSLWRYDIGEAALPFSAMPVKLNSVLVPAAASDLDRGANGNFYLGQNRSAGNESGIIVLSADGSSVLFSSLAASRELLGNPAAVDILRNVQGIAVSFDQKYLVAMLNNSDVAVLPLDENGIPRIADRMLVNTGTDIISGRDIAFDAVGNIHYVSSGQALYRVLSPGGSTAATTSWNGSTYAFSVAVPEPSCGLLLASGALLVGGRRRRIRL